MANFSVNDTSADVRRAPAISAAAGSGNSMEKPGELRFDGRILFLSADLSCMAGQMAGRDLSLAQAGDLRDDVSTDEITPVTVMMTFDHRLGRYPYVGFQVDGQRPISPDAVREGGFAVTVAGRRYGKGSSRESSPLAEKSAGIRLVIARSFEGIYRQNCDNLGLFTSTDFSLIDRIRAGQTIPLEDLLEGRDALTCEILRAGGLLNYSRRHLSGLPITEQTAGDRPMTLAQKIILRNRVIHDGAFVGGNDDASAGPTGGVSAGATPAVSATPQIGQGVFVKADWRFSHDYFTGMCAHFMHEAFGRGLSLERPEQIIAFQDHLILAPQSFPHITQNLLPGVKGLADAHREFVRDYPVRVHGALADDSGADGICHAMMTEFYALPGQVVVGTDSHTPHSGALGCLAYGAGATDIANSWVTGLIRCKFPSVIKVVLDGRLAPGVMAKDVVLELLLSEFIRHGKAVGSVLEYSGEAVKAMSIDERATLTNMVAELGGFTGIVEPDDKTAAFLRERRGVDVVIEDWMRADPGAEYQHTLRIDCSRLTPMVARPGDPGNGVALNALPQAVPVDIAYGGSCTAGKREDFDAYHEVLAWAAAHQYVLSRSTRLYLQFGTMSVRQYCEDRGYLATFERLGATMIMPGCGACANCGPGSSTSADEVTVSAINRNFPGRSGPGQVWLASPYTVAASAIAGRLCSFDELRASHMQTEPA